MTPATPNQRLRWALDPYLKWVLRWRGERALWLRQARWRSLRHAADRVVVATAWGDVIVETADQVVGQAVFAGRLLDADLLGHTLGLLGDGERGLFLDIGANIGTATLVALRSGFERALCFEPDATNATLLRGTLALNGLEGRVHIEECAVGSQEGRVSMARSDTNSGDHRVVVGDDVRIATIDALLAEQGVAMSDISLVWVDVQGFEGDVMLGADELLRSGVPWVIEFSPHILGGQTEAMYEALEGREMIRLNDETNTLDATPITVADLRAFSPSDPLDAWDILVVGQP